MTDIASKPVTAVARGTAEEELFLGELIAAGLLVPGGVDGLFGHGAEFEHLVLQFDRFVTKRGADEHATVVRFPPLISKQHYERTDHLRSFPNLVGCVHSFSGGDGEHAALLSAVESGGEWSQFFDASDLVFTPAACYPVYPMATGAIGPDGLTYDVFSYCFRHEPSRDPARLQLFRMREYVRIGTPHQCLAFRDKWAGRAHEIFCEVGLPSDIVVANDPFFGRAGRMLVANQRDQELKLEVVIPITSTSKPTACASANCHLDHFSQPFEIRQADGTWAHTACVGFGMERIALALFRVHGVRIGQWPLRVRALLEL